MNVKRFVAPVFSLALLAGAGFANAQYNNGTAYQQGPPPPPPGYQQGYQQGGQWEAPPAEFAAAQQRGFHDGVEGAKRDFQNHRPPNVNNRDEFRHPGFIPPPDRRDYKFGFKRGYDTAVRHMYGPGPRY